MIAFVIAPILATVALVAQDAYSSPSEWGYVAAGWTITIVGLLVYTLLILRKGRQLSKQVPPEERRWMS